MWTGDIIAIWTYEGWLYPAVVLDLFSRRVIGWAMAATQDETLIETALRMALLGRQPPAGLLFHSDRGSQYTSDAYRAARAGADITFHRLDHFDFCPSSPEVGHKVVPLFNGKLEIRTIFSMHPGIDLVEYPKVIGRTHEIRFAP